MVLNHAYGNVTIDLVNKTWSIYIQGKYLARHKDWNTQQLNLDVADIIADTLRADGADVHVRGYYQIDDDGDDDYYVVTYVVAKYTLRNGNVLNVFIYNNGQVNIG